MQVLLTVNFITNKSKIIGKVKVVFINEGTGQE